MDIRGFRKGDDTCGDDCEAMSTSPIGFDNLTLSCGRLTYRLIAEADRESLREILSDPDLTRPAGYMPAKDDADFEKFWHGLTDHKAGIAILYKNECIGYFNVHPYKADSGEYAGKNNVSVGFIIGRRYQKQGFGTEAVGVLTAYLKRRFDYVFGECFEENAASEKTLRKCGYRYVETYRMFFDKLCEEKKVLSFVY